MNSIPQSPAFTTTHWSVVLCAGGEDSPTVQSAITQLCTVYWYPLYAHVRRRGHGPEDAADLTQEFLCGLLRKRSFSTVAPEKGRFRTFLLTSLDYFLHDQNSRAMAAKRGGGRSAIPLESLSAEERYSLEPATEETPDKAFDRRWAAALVERVFERLAEEQGAAGKAELFNRLRPFLGRDVERGDYESLAIELALPSNTVAKMVQRLRLRARELLREEAAQTVATLSDVDQELRDLFR